MQLCGHSVPVQNATYAKWRTESIQEDSIDITIKFRDIIVIKGKKNSKFLVLTCSHPPLWRFCVLGIYVIRDQTFL